MPVGSSAEVKDATHDVETQDWTKVTMIASLLVAATFALGHHFFLQALHGDPVESQFWIKNANNAVSHAVSICLGIAAGVSLTQAVSATLAVQYLIIIVPSLYSIFYCLYLPGALTRLT